MSPKALFAIPSGGNVRVGILASFFGLLFLWPVLVIVAIMVKVKMPGGPAFFVQQRVGKGGKLFTCHKFRSMTVAPKVNTNSDSNDIHSDRPAIVGYCFLRSFFLGKGFRGRMVGIDYRGRGLGTQMNRLLNEVGFSLGLRIFETVNKENVASYRSALSASDVRIVEELEGNDLYLEILPSPQHQ